MQEVSPLDTPLGKYLQALMQEPENEKLLGAEPLEEFIQRRLDIYLEEFESAIKETKTPAIAHDRAMVEMTAGLVEYKVVENDVTKVAEIQDEDFSDDED